MAPNSFRKGQRGYPDFETESDGLHSYMQPGSSSSNPTWDFTSSDPNHTSGGYEPPRQSSHLVLEDEDEPKEWMGQVEPGVQIAFVSLANGGNDLKRIRSTDRCSINGKCKGDGGEKYDRIMELYDVQRFNCQALNTPSRSEDRVAKERTKIIPLNKDQFTNNMLVRGNSVITIPRNPN